MLIIHVQNKLMNNEYYAIILYLPFTVIVFRPVSEGGGAGKIHKIWALNIQNVN